MKLCKDCRYRGSLPVLPPIYCEAPQADRSPINGHSVETCDDARMDHQRCGIHAQWFEAKPERRPFWMQIFG